MMVGDRTIHQIAFEFWEYQRQSVHVCQDLYLVRFFGLAGFHVEESDFITVDCDQIGLSTQLWLWNQRA